MEPFSIALAKVVVPFLLVAGTGLTAFRFWLNARVRPQAELDRIIEALREENAQLRADLGAEMAELEERVDFVERRLAESPQPSRLPPPLTG